MRTLLLLLSLLVTSGSRAAQTSRIPVRICPPGVEDEADPTKCLAASSVPREGALYPLSRDLFVTPTGRVGMGTKAPRAGLELIGPPGPDSTLRVTTLGDGTGGLRLSRESAVPADWGLGVDIDPFSTDFVIYNYATQQERLRIDGFGNIRGKRVFVGEGTDGGTFGSFSDGRFFLGQTIGSTTYANFSGDRFGIDISSPLSIATATIDDDDGLVFTSSDPGAVPMIRMFTGGTSNPDRMVLAHSDDFDDWGLRYDDNEDVFHFLGGGNGVMSVRLRSANGQVGIEVANPTNILTIQQGSATDPIADAWTTYSSRRWKENVRPIETPLDKVRALRGVRFDWKESGEPDLGMIAEEVGAVVPEVVAFEENGVDAQSIDYARLSALLIEAVKEQDAQIAALSERIARLEER